MNYTVIGDDAYLELTRSDLVTLLAKLDDDDDCAMVTHDNGAVWKVLTITALEDAAESHDGTENGMVPPPVETFTYPNIMDRGE